MRTTLILLLLCILKVNSIFAFTDTSSADKNNLAVFPIVARSIETGWAFGIVNSLTFRPFKKDTTTRTSSLQLIGLYTTNKQLICVLNGTTYFKKEKYVLNYQVSYSNFPDKFWGMGKYAENKNMEKYSFRQFYFYNHLQRKIWKHFFGGGILEYQRVMDIHYTPGGLFDQQQIVGRNGYRVMGIGASITYDTRNHAFVPNKGAYAQGAVTHFNPIFGSDYMYTNIVVDAKKYIQVYKQHVLALRAYGFINVGNEIPLRSQAALGGANEMRGYYDGRYKDNNMILAMMEYRVPIYRRFGAAFFCSGGNVGKTLSDVNFEAFKFCYGSGIRFALNRKEKLNLRIDYGFSLSKSNGLYLEIAEAF
jgi:outer membrane protein assembly factor BamA